MEQLVAQRQGQEQTQEESRQGQTGQPGKALRVYGESRFHRLGLI